MEFKESHRFKNWIRISSILIPLIIFSIFGYGFNKQIIHGELFGDRPMSDTVLIFAFSLTLLLLIIFTIFFGFSKLTIEINEKTIKYRFYPIHFRFREIDWNNVDKYEIGTAKEIYKSYSIANREKLKIEYIYMSFDNGLVLYLKNGKLIVIGIKNNKDLQEYLKMIK